MNDELDAEIDELAVNIEKQIDEGREFIDELPEFDPKYRRMAEADVPDVDAMFA